MSVLILFAAGLHACLDHTVGACFQIDNIYRHLNLCVGYSFPARITAFLGVNNVA